MFRAQKYSSIGLDLRSDLLPMVQLKRTGQGWCVHRATLKESTFGEPPEGAHDLERLVGEVKNRLKEGAFSGRAVVSTLPENQVDIFPIKLSLKGDEDLEAALVREAQSYLAYDLNEAIIDYIVVQDVAFGSEEKRSVKVLLIGARRGHVDAHLDLLKGAGLKPVAIEIPSCALARVFRYAGQGSGQSLLVVDMDESTTTLTGLRDQAILFERSIPAGRDDLISDLCQHLKLERGKSKDLLSRSGLRSAGDDVHHGDSSKGRAEGHMMQTVMEILNPQLEKLARELEKVLIYYTSEMRGERIEEIVLTGCCGSIAHMDRWIASRIQLPTSLFDLHRIPGVLESASLPGKHSRHGTYFSVALGLALRGLQLSFKVRETVTS